MMSDAEHPPGQMTDAQPPITDGAPAPDDVGPVTAVDLLFDEAHAAVAQEIALIRALAAAGALTGRNVAIMGIAAILVALVALMTLAIGAMFAIAAQFGFGVATGVVVGVLVLAGAVLTLLMRQQIRRFRSAARRSEP